ncbi:MAG TPA: TlpA disulfide reductase family protein [Thermoanaerobaculia bacterium]|nr:TlpA disulfide reductase family protein [Thermoanaerobaculia bacterium]
MHDQAGVKPPARSRPRSALRAAGAILAAAVLGSGGALSGAPPSRLAGELDAGGLLQAISREKGRVVLVNFWATWCVPCREEFPLLTRLEKKHRRAGLSVLGVSTDFQKEKAAVEKFLAQQKPSFPNYRKKSGGDDQKFIEAVDSSWGGELPFSVLYDRSGRKVRVFSGELEIAVVEKQIVQLLGARAPAGR